MHERRGGSRLIGRRASIGHHDTVGKVPADPHGGRRQFQPEGEHRAEHDRDGGRPEGDGSIVAVGAPIEDASLHVPFAAAEDRYISSLVETSAIALLAAEWWERRLAAGSMP